MANNSVSFSIFLVLVFVLAISEIATVKGKICEKPSKTWFGNCKDSEKCDHRCIDWEGAKHGACHQREAKYMCFCYFDCDPSKNPGPPKPPAGGKPPAAGTPPPADGAPPPAGGEGGAPPPAGGEGAPPPAEGGGEGGAPPPAEGGGEGGAPPPAEGGGGGGEGGAAPPAEGGGGGEGGPPA